MGAVVDKDRKRYLADPVSELVEPAGSRKVPETGRTQRPEVEHGLTGGYARHNQIASTGL